MIFPYAFITCAQSNATKQISSDGLAWHNFFVPTGLVSDAFSKNEVFFTIAWYTFATDSFANFLWIDIVDVQTVIYFANYRSQPSLLQVLQIFKLLAIKKNIHFLDTAFRRLNDTSGR